jgi:hypothetical protein
MRGPAARPPAGRRRALAGPTLLRPAGSADTADFPEARPRHRGSGVACRYRRRWVRVLAAAAAGGFGIAIPDPGFPQTAARHPARRDGSVGGAWGRLVVPAWRPPPRPAFADGHAVARAHGGPGSLPRRGPVLVGLRWSHAVFGHLPARVPVRIVLPQRNLVGGAYGAAAPGGAGPPASNAADRARTRRRQASTNRPPVGVRSAARISPHRTGFYISTVFARSPAAIAFAGPLAAAL